MNGRIFVCPERAAPITGVSSDTLYNWVRLGTTSYGYPLNVMKNGKHRLIDEADVRVMAAVNRDFPLAGGGPGKRERCEQMKGYALRLKAALTPAP